MQAEAPSKSSADKRGWIWPVLAVVGIGLAIILSNRDAKGPGGAPAVRSDEEFNQTFKKATDLCTGPFAKLDRDEPFSAADLAQLRQALALYQSTAEWKPQQMGPFLQMGEIHYWLDETGPAKESFEQSIENVPYMTNAANFHTIELLNGRALYGLARCDLKENNFADALQQITQAIKITPSEPAYYYVRARAEAQLGEVPMALADMSKVNHLAKGQLRHEWVSFMSFLSTPAQRPPAKKG